MRGAKLFVSGEISPGRGGRLHRNNRGQHGSELRGHAFGHDQRAGGKIESAELVVAFFDGGEQFVAQTQIQREFWRDPPVILPVEGVHLVVIVDVVQVIDAAAVAQAHQKRRKSGAAGKLAAAGLSVRPGPKSSVPRGAAG